MKQSALEILMAAQIEQSDLPEPETEYRFWSGRKFRFDFAWPRVQIALEVEGGTWSGGRHTRGQGFEDDCIKYNEAVIFGWRVLRCTRKQVEYGVALDYLERLMKA